MKRVLLVEDDMFLAFDLAQQLGEAGLQVIGPAGNVDQALALIAEPGCDIAVLDVNLGGGRTSESVALELRRRSIPFVTVSGYANDQHPPAFAGAPQVVKPVHFETLLELLHKQLALAAGSASSDPK